MRNLTVFLTAVMLLALSSCNFKEVEVETGYKGKARINPWLAAERIVDRYGHVVRSETSWSVPESDEAVYFIPASVLANSSFINRMDEWISDEGGHLIVMLENASSEQNDWYPTQISEPPPEVLKEWLERRGLELVSNPTPENTSNASTPIGFEDDLHQANAWAETAVQAPGEEPALFASIELGLGRLSVLADARPLRNRWIGEHEHAAFLMSLIDHSDYEGAVVFLRGTGVSFWAMLGKHLWAFLIAFSLLILLWLWKNLVRFGAIDTATEVPPVRGYDHHLEALGDFQWRLDHCNALLTPLRTRIIERAQRFTHRAGLRDEDVFQVLADRADLPRERVFRALAEPSPADSSVLTRTTADLQRLLQAVL